MKLIPVLLSLICSLNFIQNENNSIQEYIVVQFNGVEQRPSKQLMIVLNEPNLRTIYSVLKSIDVDTTSMKEEEAVSFKNLLFNTIITDRKTFSLLKQYVSSYKSKFNDARHSRYSVIVNDRRYLIPRRQEKVFLKGFNILLKD